MISCPVYSKAPGRGEHLLDFGPAGSVCSRGRLSDLDDTVVEKPYARLLGEAAWLWSNKQHKVVFGVVLVLLVERDGQCRIPVGYRVWQKGNIEVDLALELLSYARNRLRCKPQFVLFDSWYPAERLLKRLKDYGWYFVCQLKKNRVLTAWRCAPTARTRIGMQSALCLEDSRYWW